MTEIEKKTAAVRQLWATLYDIASSSVSGFGARMTAGYLLSILRENFANVLAEELRAAEEAAYKEGADEDDPLNLTFYHGREEN